MAHILSPEAELELDAIWYYIARESGNSDVADHFIDYLTERFHLLALNPYMARRRDDDLRPGMEAFPCTHISFFVESKTGTCGFCMWCGAAGAWTCFSASSGRLQLRPFDAAPNGRGQRPSHFSLC